MLFGAVQPLENDCVYALLPLLDRRPNSKSLAGPAVV
jgi:hypothetical protein